MNPVYCFVAACFALRRLNPVFFVGCVTFACGQQRWKNLIFVTPHPFHPNPGIFASAKFENFKVYSAECCVPYLSVQARVLKTDTPLRLNLRFYAPHSLQLRILPISGVQ